MHGYRIRQPVAIGTCATVPVVVLLAWLGVGVLAGRLWLGACVGLVGAAAGFVPAYRRVRRRSLTVTPDGLEVQRDQYRLVVPWAAVSCVQQRRHQLVMAVEELVVTGAEIVPLDSRGRPATLPSQLTSGHPAPTRIMVSLYDENWRSGPIGERLREIGDPQRTS